MRNKMFEKDKPLEPRLSRRVQKEMSKTIFKIIRRISDICGDMESDFSFQIDPKEKIDFKLLVREIQASPNLTFVRSDEETKTIVVRNSKPRVSINCEDLFGLRV